jgi:hypothetical protein
MVGRVVRDAWAGVEGRVVRWEPLGAGMTDTLVERPNGSLVWVSSHSLKATDAAGPLPSRQDARHAADLEAARSLEAIRAKHVAEMGEPWPGAEFGKGIIGMAITGAQKDVKKRLRRKR